MTSYKEKFESSEGKAHSKNVATKILRDLKDLRSKTEDSVTAPRRWIWELIQNAKEVASPSGVDIRVTYDQDDFLPSVNFEHNGMPFSADNIRFLIEQISSKEREEDSEGKRPSTGKFGTGFLTTHLLSEIVTVPGVAKEPELSARKFSFTLDRSHYDLKDIADSVNKSKQSVSNLDDLPELIDYNPSDFGTSFYYPLNDGISENIARLGLEDLGRNIAYALVFVEDIKKVTVAGSFTYVNASYEILTNEKEVQFFDVIKESPGDKEVFTIAKISSGFTSVCVPVKKVGKTVIILPIDKDVPKLFCDFPLIGTEVFSFPVIINNPNFNPTDPRDGIYLTRSERPNRDIDENKKIIDEAIQLYYLLLNHASDNRWENLHLLAKIRSMSETPDWLSQSYFNDNILKPIRAKLLYAKIVKNAEGNLKSILDHEDDRKYMYFPSHPKKEIREEIWEVASEWFPHILPQKTEIDLWYNLSWDQCGKLTLDTLALFISQKKTIDELQKKLPKIDAVKWLNKVYKLLMLDEKECITILEQRAIVPDQNGDFWKKKQLSLDAGDILDDFKNILEAFGYEIRTKLADDGIELDFDDRLYDLNKAVKEIVSQVEEKTNDRESSKNYRKPFNMLLSFFNKYPEKSKNIFPSIFKRKHILYDDEQILNNFGKAEELDKLFVRFNVTSTSELASLLEQTHDNSPRLLPITEEILTSMGITSPEEWALALEDKDLQELFKHDSVPTTEMFVFAQTHIHRAKKAVIDHLETLKEYDLTEMDDQTATTILAGIYKNGSPLTIVFRPAYNYEVIIYYGSERDTLDYEPSELWIDNGIDVKQITLGHILKAGQIRKFPI